MIELEETSHYLPHEGVANVADATLERRRCSGRDVEAEGPAILSRSQLSIWRLLLAPQRRRHVHVSLGRSVVSCFRPAVMVMVMVSVSPSSYANAVAHVIGARYSVCLGPVYVGPA